MPRCAPPQPSDAPAAPPFVWTDLATSDVEQPAAMQQHWMPMRYDQVDRGRFAGRYRQLDVDGMLVVTEQQNRTVLKQQYTPPEYCTVSLIRDLAAPGRCELEALHDKTIGYMPGGRDYEILMPPSDILFFRLDRARFLDAADTLGIDLPGAGRAPLFVNGLAPERLQAAADAVMSVAAALGPAQLAGAAPAYLGKLLLAHLAEAIGGLPAGSPPTPPGNARRLTHAASALVAEADTPLTVLDLCRALKVSRATLHRGFVEIYGLSPLAYLRMRRLNGARRALIAARGSNATVTAIATHWSFFHLARFARDYRNQFGELPSATLDVQAPQLQGAPAAPA